MKVISSDSGNATPGMNVSVARPRKAKITITTSTKAMIKSRLNVGNRVNDVCEAVVDRRDP